jgi:hypothetical protein
MVYDFDFSTELHEMTPKSKYRVVCMLLWVSLCFSLGEALSESEREMSFMSSSPLTILLFSQKRWRCVRMKG